MSSPASTVPDIPTPTPTRPPIDPVRAAESNSALFITIVCVVWACAFVAASLRFYTRAVLVRSFGKDDVFMVFAVVWPL